MISVARWMSVGVVLLGAAAFAQVPVGSLQASKGHDAARLEHGAGVSAATEVDARFRARVSLADRSQRGEAWFVFSADLDGQVPAHVTVRIPLASTEDAYGESRSCGTGANGKRELVFTAGLEEANFVRFAAAESGHEFHFLLNKYLCRVLAAPFRCGDHEVSLPSDVSRWRLAAERSVVLSSDAPAAMDASPVAVEANSQVFDYARCAVIAPSNGMCCVGGKTTEWHCGGTPVGEGWHQVSGECFHRETGGSCTE